jgi:hypothetical protein
MFEALCCLGYSTLNGLTLNGNLQWESNNIGYLQGTITNHGAITFHSPSGTNVVLDVNGAVTLKGSGTLTSTNPNNAIMGYAQAGPGASLTNQSTIQGKEQFGGPGGIGTGNSLINDTNGTLYANPGPLIINVATGTFTNKGTLKVKSGGSMSIPGGGFTNFSGTTLTGGIYMVSGTLEFDGANIGNNAANISLMGSKSMIVNQSAVNALANFANNMSTGSFSLSGGALLTTTIGGSFTNNGKMTIGNGSGFQVAAASPYLQMGSTATTTVDGVLTAARGVTINSGKLFGTGTIASPLTSSGSVMAGDTPTKAGRLSPSAYTQNSGGSLNIQIGGTIMGTQYSQLAVANGASLKGTLNVKLIGGFVPAIGDTFTILTTSARTGTFTTVNLPTLSGAHFTVTYNPTNVTLTVVSGSGDLGN